MVGRRKKTFPGWQPGLYEYQGKRRNTYYTITTANERINLGHDLVKAKKALLEIEEVRSFTGTIGELLDDYLQLVKAKVEAGKRSARTYRDNVVEAAQLKKAFGRMPPSSLKTSHVWTYLHKARGKEAPVRANREIALLSAAFNHAANAGIVERNPCIGAQRNEETPRDRYISDAELLAFVEFARAGKHLANDGCPQVVRWRPAPGTRRPARVSDRQEPIADPVAEQDATHRRRHRVHEKKTRCPHLGHLDTGVTPHRERMPRPSARTPWYVPLLQPRRTALHGVWLQSYVESPTGGLGGSRKYAISLPRSARESGDRRNRARKESERAYRASR